MRLAELDRMKTGNPLLDICMEAACKEDGKLVVWCSREEATHVSGYGLAGCIAPLEKIKVTGSLAGWWSKELIEDHRKAAQALIGEYVF